MEYLCLNQHVFFLKLWFIASRSFGVCWVGNLLTCKGWNHLDIIIGLICCDLISVYNQTVSTGCLFLCTICAIFFGYGFVACGSFHSGQLVLFLRKLHTKSKQVHWSVCVVVYGLLLASPYSNDLFFLVIDDRIVSLFKVLSG